MELAIQAPKLNFKKLKLSEHALKRAKERLSCSSLQRNDILNLCKSLIGSSNTSYVGISPCEDGNNCHMFVHKKHAFHISLDLSTIVTIVNHESKVGNVRHYIGLQGKIKLIYEKELTKIQKLELVNLRKLELIKLKENIDISQIKYKMHCTRSKTAKANYGKKLIEVCTHSRLIQSELDQIRNTKHNIMQTMASTVYG